MQVPIQRAIAVKAFFAISVHLIKGFAYVYASFFQFHLHHRQPVNQYGYIISIGLRTSLFKLVNHLQLVSRMVVFVNQHDVLQVSVVEREVAHAASLYFSCSFYDAVVLFIQKLIVKTFPFGIGKHDIVKRLQLYPCIVEQGFGRIKVGQIFVALVSKVGNKLAFQLGFRLVTSRCFVQHGSLGVAV